jgi:hypothetical protein
MKVIESVAVTVLLLMAVGTTPVLAQAVERPGTAHADVVAGNAALSGSPVNRLQARVGPDQLPPSATARVEFLPVSRYAPASDAPVYIAVRQDRRRGLTFVLVGAALIGAGLLIDGDAGAAVSVGGAVLGAYGVYLMVRSER